MSLSTQPRHSKSGFGDDSVNVLELNPRPESNQTFLERPENGCPPTVTIQPDKGSAEKNERQSLNQGVQSLLHHIQKDLRL